MKLPVVVLSAMPLVAPFDARLMNEKVPPVLESETAVPVVGGDTHFAHADARDRPGRIIHPVLLVELIWRPLTVALVLSVTVLPRLVMVPLPLFIAGSELQKDGTVIPVMVATEAVASCPINFCPVRNVTAPVYLSAALIDEDVVVSVRV